MKTCPKCKASKPEGDFGKDRSRKDGLYVYCAACLLAGRRANKVKIAAGNRKYQEANREKIAAYKKKYSRDNRERLTEYMREYGKNNRTTLREYGKIRRAAFSEDHREALNAKTRERAKTNRPYLAAQRARRRATEKLATPAWADSDAIVFMYAKRKELSDAWGITLHVDHIVPLNSDLVCGLHCPDNLQLIEESLNLTKSNKLEQEI